MANIRDVAVRARVSPATVSRVLSGDPRLRVADDTRARVVDAVRELKYVPSHAGRSLRTARSRAVAVVVPDVTSAVFAELTAGATEAATERGLTVVLARAEEVNADSEWMTRVVGEGRVDGLILQIPDGSPPDLIDALALLPIPIVVINSVDHGPLNTIVLNDAAGVRTAVDHLVDLGHRDIGFIGGVDSSATGTRRRNAFIESLRAHKLSVPGESSPAGWVTACGYSGQQGRVAATKLLSLPNLPTALVVANLNAALGVLAEVHRSPLRVPDDMSLVALHDVWYADSIWPPLTTVRMPLRQLGAAAVELVAESRTSETVHSVVGEAPVLIVRESTTSRPVL
ncbi:LacI family DNA-binding transcriptional regulator [Microcella sp.]|uniref:LacI family DNA-binding transcriptional regulator n=1 Tax=Microcella sp. TaxID=1913979 RepID=UPI00256B0936|nr:LacI family DNA-binding transcriptional regulator [Microcella sp.]MBX9471484.1 LacI family transcriptional regulator [Microcella sp.]